MSSPRVCSFMGSIVNSSSFAVISVNTTQIKMHNWAVTLTSVDSSNCSEKLSLSAMSFQSCCVKSSAMTLQRHVTVLLGSWRALIEDNIYGLFFKVPKQQVSRFNEYFIYHLSILERLLVLNDGVTHPERCFGGCLSF